jgi:hypothetical protein
MLHFIGSWRLCAHSLFCVLSGGLRHGDTVILLNVPNLFFSFLLLTSASHPSLPSAKALTGL